MPRHLPTDPAFRSLLLAVLCTACNPKPSPSETPQPPAEPATEQPDEPPGIPPLPGVDMGRADETPTDEPLVGPDLLTPIDGVTKLALIQHSSGMNPSTWSVLGQVGDLCADDTCTAHQQALADATHIRRECGQIGCTEWYLMTDGADHTVVTTPEQLVAVLGTIDTPAEARLLAWSKGFDVASMPVQKEGLFAVVAKEDISDCPVQVDDVHLSVSPNGTVTETSRVENPTSMCVGRLAPVCRQPACIPQSAGEWLAQAAAMEAESAVAFRILARELTALDAPDALVDACLAAAEDEDRHARAMRAHAEQYGATVPAPPPAPTHLRGALAIAIDNAAEGLGREAWGTLLAFWQARHAPDAALRATFSRIGGDEARHAEISRALHRWLMPMLTETEQQTVTRAAQQTWAGVADGLSAIPAEVRAALGLPAEPRVLYAAARQHGLAA